MVTTKKTAPTAARMLMTDSRNDPFISQASIAATTRCIGSLEIRHNSYYCHVLSIREIYSGFDVVTNASL